MRATVRWAAVIAGLMIVLPGVGQPVALDEAALMRWLDRYGAAWVARDAEAAAALFTEDGEYAETPFAEPFRGREEIAEYWSTVTADQRDIRFDSEVLAIDGDIGVARWSASFEAASTGAAVDLDGVFVLEFESADRVSRLREWWFVRAEDQPTP